MRVRAAVRSLMVASIFLLLLGLLLTSPNLILLAVLPLTLLAIPALCTKVEVLELKAPPEVKTGERFDVVVNVDVSGFGLFKLMHNLPETFELEEGTNAVARFVIGKSAVKLKYTCVAHRRGVYDIGKLVIEVESLFSASRRVISLNADKSIEVKAKVHRVRKFEMRRGVARRPMPEVDVSPIGPPGTDFREIRKYVPGDPVKFINWKATARLSELMVNEFEKEGKKAIWLFLDANPYMMHGMLSRNCFDVAVEVAASLCYYFAVRGHKVGVYVAGHGILVYPESGRRQFRKVFETLMRLDPPSTTESLSIAVQRAMKYVEALRSAAIFITRAERSKVSEAVRSCMKRSRPIAVLTVVNTGEDALSGSISRRILEREVRRLRRMDVQVYEIESDKPLEKILARVAR